MLCDSNVWLALIHRRHSNHRVVHDWFETVLEPKSVFFCRATQQSLLRLLTSAAIFARFGDPPLTIQQAWGAYDTLLADDRIAFLAHEPAGLESRWRQYATRNTASPKLWMDAYLAAFAQAGGYRMVTTDAAFRQFAGLDLALLGSS